MNPTHQREDATSNAQAGDDFEKAAASYFDGLGISVTRNYKVKIGAAERMKDKRFDLGAAEPPIIVECKSHRWTKGKKQNSPSAKMAVWNEAMFYFTLVRANTRKVLFVLRHINPKSGELLADYYLRRFGHLVPEDVEIWEFDEVAGKHRVIRPE